MKKRKLLITILIIIIALAVIGFGLNFIVRISARNQILTEDELSEVLGSEDFDCILVLGAGIWGDEPSPMLADRITEGISLYEKNAAPKLLMSGDHGRAGYDEVSVMKRYAIERNVPSEDIFMDHAGFSTYESVYRARDVFGAKKIVIVTQKYHLYRAVFIAKRLGLEVYGVNSDPRAYAGQTYREVREILARDKDFVKCIFKPKPTYLGNPISLKGSGDVTND